MVLEKQKVPVIVLVISLCAIISLPFIMSVFAFTARPLVVIRDVIVDQSQEDTSQSHELSAVSHHKLAQSFKPSMKTLTNVSIHMYRETTAADRDVELAVYNTSNSADGTDLPAFDDNITGFVSIPASQINQGSGARAWYTFTLSQPIDLIIGRTYWIVIRMKADDCLGDVKYQVSESADSGGGAYSQGVQRYSGGACYNFLNDTSLERDLAFRSHVYEPLITIDSPANQTYINYTWFNITLLASADWCGLSYDGGANVTMSNDTSTHYFYNKTNMTAGQHTVLFWCNFSGGIGNESSEALRYFSVDVTTPDYENTSTSRVSPTVYEKTGNHGFQIYARDNFMSFGGVNLSLYNDSWVNYTATNASNITNGSWISYQVNITGLEVDNYTYKWYVWDGLHWNTTGNFTEYNVTKATPFSLVMLDGNIANETYEWGSTINITSYANDPVLSTTIYANFSGAWTNLTSNVSGQNTYLYDTITLAVGAYKVGANTTGNRNYFDNATHFNLTVSIIDSYGPNITFSSPQQQSYGDSSVWVNITTNENASWCGVSYEGGSNQSMSNTSETSWFFNQTGLTEGNHTLVVYCNDTNSNFAYNETWFISDFTAPNVSNVYTSPESPATYSLGGSYHFNATIQDAGIVNTTILSIAGVNYTMTYLADNASLSPTGKIYGINVTGLGVGNYTYYFYVNDSLGNSNTTETFFYNITKAVPYTMLLLNGSAGSISVDYGQTANMTSYASDPVLSTTIYANFSGGSLELVNGPAQGQNTFLKNTGELVIATYQISANATGNANYTDNATFVTYYLNVQDMEKPKYAAVSVWPTGLLQYDTIYYFASNWTDNYGMDSVIFSENSSGSYQNHTVTNISGSRYTYNMNYADLQGVETLGWRFYGIDNSSQNVNQTDIQQLEIKAKTSAALSLSPSAVTINNMTVDGYNFTLTTTMTNSGGNTMYYSNISLALRSGWYANASYALCQNITSGSSCTKNFEIYVPGDAGIGTFTVKVYGNWTNPDHATNSTTGYTSVNIAENKDMEIGETAVTGTVNHSSTAYIGSFSANSTGNTMVTNVVINTTGGNLNSSWITFINRFNEPSTGNITYDSIAYDSSETVYVNMSIPAGQSPGLYWTNITAYSDGVFRDWLYLNVTVPEDKSWTLDKTQFPNQTLEYGSSGTLGTVNLTNTGNVNRHWSFGLGGTGYTIFSLNPSLSAGITVNRTESGIVTINYNTGGLSPGYYETTLTITNTSCTPTSRNVLIPFTIQNLPPSMTSVQASPLNIETEKTTVISADVRDASGVSTVWITINLPNGSVENYTMNVPTPPSITYTKTYKTHRQGTYSYQIYSNDTDGESNSTALNYFFANSATNISVKISPTSVTFSNITALSGNSTTLNVTLTNTGNVTAYYLNLSLTASGNISVNSTLSDFANLSSGSQNSSVHLITVSAGTPAGTYSVPLTAAWINPNGTVWTNTTSFQVVVQQNPRINITHDLNLTMAQMASELHNFTCYSFGNQRASDVNFTCSNCSEISVTFSPSTSSIPANSTQEVEMNITIPAGQSPGSYTLLIYANGSGVSNFSTIDLYVQQNRSWIRSPETIYLISGKDNTGTAGYVTISNYGNVPINFTINVSGDTAYIGTNVTYQNVAPQTSALVAVNYTSSAIGNFTANVTVSNSSASPPVMNTTVNLSVLNFNISLTGVSPTVNMSAGDTIVMLADAFLENSPLSENITWSASLNGTDCPVTHQSNIVNEVWTINCTAPTVTDGKNYSLRLTANYTTRSAVVFDEREINYADVSPPYLTDYQYTEVIANETLNLSLNITDNVLVDNATAVIEYPNGTRQSVNISNATQTFMINFTSTSGLGEYKVIVTANDTSNNTNSSIEAFFAIYKPVIFNGTVKDASGTAVSSNFSFYRPRSGLLATTITSDSNGDYNGSVKSLGNMTLNVSVFGSSLLFRDVTLLNNKEDPFAFDNIPSTEISGKVLKALFVNTSLNYSNVTLLFDYTGTDFTNEDYIGVYRCPAWNFGSRTCNSSWSRLSNVSKNKVTNMIQVLTSTLSSYVVAEYICGDDSCETSYGESCSVCSSDCGVCSIGGTTGVAGGGAAGGGGAGGGAGEVTPTKELKSSLSKSSLRLKRGESETIFLHLQNRLGSNVSIAISQFNLTKFVTIAKRSLTLEDDSKEDVVLTFSVPEKAVPGVYLGDILLDYNNKTDKLPFSLTVITKGKKLSLSLGILNKEVSRDELLRYRVVISNIGEETGYPVRILHTIREIAGDRLLYSEEENITIGDRVSLSKNVSLADLVIKSNELSLEIKIYYDSDVEEVVDTFVVVHWLLRKIFSLEIWRFALGLGILVFGSVPVYYAYALRKRVIEKRKRYKIEIDFDKLPIKSSASAFVGKVAETDKKAYLELDNLTTHVMVAGATGSGKTVASQAIAEEALMKKKNVIIFDPSAQWTGFLRKCKEDEMLGLYKYFGLKESDVQAFSGTIKIVRDPMEFIDMKSIINSKEPRITIFTLNQLKPEEIDIFVANTVTSVFAARLPESKSLKTLMIYDEVHRLLPKFGGSGKGFIQVERGAREFRKWGIGMVLVSQVLSDFVGEIRANIGMEIQMRTRYEEDLNRLARKYGENIARSIVKAKVGAGLFEYSEYNNGKPYFISFRPLLHQITRLSDKELEQYDQYSKRIEYCKFQLDELRKRKIDVFDIEVELKLADQKLAQGAFDMSNMYLEGIESRIKSEWKRLGVKPPERKEQLIDKEKLKKAMEEAKKERMKFVKESKQKKQGETSVAKIEEIYDELKSVVSNCKKHGVETFVEEIEIERIPSTIDMLRMSQNKKEIKAYFEKLKTMRDDLKDKLGKASDKTAKKS